ncbi:MarR family transcriptional regulator, partial [Algoriphagus aestuarii]|nr:MarR family transcriptional regulator [Algoriphagus aestuarii]
MYQIIWAAEHAPIANAEERAILVALAVRGDPDGCNCYRSVATLARAARVSKRTVQRRLKDLTVRGIIREQPWDPP